MDRCLTSSFRSCQVVDFTRDTNDLKIFSKILRFSGLKHTCPAKHPDLYPIIVEWLWYYRNPIDMSIVKGDIR